MAIFISEFKELEIGDIRFNKGCYNTEDPREIAFLEKVEALRRYKVKRVDAPLVSEALKDKKK